MLYPYTEVEARACKQKYLKVYKITLFNCLQTYEQVQILLSVKNYYDKTSTDVCLN